MVNLDSIIQDENILVLTYFPMKFPIGCPGQRHLTSYFAVAVGEVSSLSPCEIQGFLLFCNRTFPGLGLQWVICFTDHELLCW